MSHILFISYPSESWNFAQRIADHLGRQISETIFIDYRSIDRPDFFESILSNLRASEAILLVVTEYTFADIHQDNDWVRIEIRTALENRIPIVMVRENGLLPPHDLPQDIYEVNRAQGIPFYREFFDPGIALLRDFLVRIGVATIRTEEAPPVFVSSVPFPLVPSDSSEPQREIGGEHSINEAADLLEMGDFEKALFLLSTVDKSRVRSVLRQTIDDLMEHGRKLQEAFERRRDALLDYELITRLANRKLTHSSAEKAFRVWISDYPELVEELDTESLRDLWKIHYPTFAPQIRKRSINILPAPFDWVTIPTGIVTVAEGGYAGRHGYKVRVPEFLIAKYPVTTAQFQRFMDAGGYSRREWWTEAGWEAKLRGWDWDGNQWIETDQPWIEPRYLKEHEFSNPNQPIIGVSWYEAVAFCLWLSDTTSENIMLPSESMWQRAAQGDDGRAFPWGNTWDCTKCTNSASPCEFTVTTEVTTYEGVGDSPYGVVDMSGNVWEWCRTEYESGSDDIHARGEHRLLRGGSWYYTDSEYFRCDYRNWNVPYHRNYYRGWGFRLAVEL